jgi:1-acyl-sn-glycerol-3-phosphate acyltransferase
MAEARVAGVIRAALAVVFLVFYILLVGTLFVLHAMATGSVETLYRAGVGGAKFALRIAGVRVRAEGVEQIPFGVCLFVANHASNLDPPAVVGAIPRRVALLAKREVFRVPILATALRMASFIPVDRSNREAAISSVEEATGHLKGGVSYLIFPEGTRSPDGRLRAFKKGTFVMAIKAGVPVVPVAVIGAQRLMQKGSAAVRAGEVVVRFLPPVDAGAYWPEEKEALIARVHAAIAAALPDEQKPLAE